MHRSDPQWINFNEFYLIVLSTISKERGGLFRRRWRQIVGGNNEKIAAIEKSDKSEQYAKLIAASPYLLEALRALVELIGDGDVLDNGELSGAAICDMARTAIEVVDTPDVPP